MGGLEKIVLTPFVPELAADGAVVAAQPTSNLSQAEFEQLQVIDDEAFF